MNDVCFHVHNSLRNSKLTINQIEWKNNTLLFNQWGGGCCPRSANIDPIMFTANRTGSSRSRSRMSKDRILDS